MIHLIPGFFVLLTTVLIGPSIHRTLAVTGIIVAGLISAFALNRSFRWRTTALLGVLILMVVQSLVFVTFSLSSALTRSLPPEHLADSLWPLFSALFIVNSGAAFVGALAAGCAALFVEFGKSRLDMSKALPELKFIDAPAEVSDTVKRLADLAGISPPETVLVDTGTPSAFTIRANRKYSIAVSVGLLESLNPSEVEACIAHEIAHLKNNDFRIRALATLAKVALFARLPSYLIEPAIYRAREFLADETAAKMIGGPNSLVSALSKLEESITIVSQSMPNSMCTCNLVGDSSLHKVFGKHPSLESRIKVLQEMR
jgi:heat shock protein HtpX